MAASMYYVVQQQQQKKTMKQNVSVIREITFKQILLTKKYIYLCYKTPNGEYDR